MDYSFSSRSLLLLVCLVGCECLLRDKTNFLQFSKSSGRNLLDDLPKIPGSSWNLGERRGRSTGQCGLSDSDLLEMNPVSDGWTSRGG